MLEAIPRKNFEQVLDNVSKIQFEESTTPTGWNTWQSREVRLLCVITWTKCMYCTSKKGVLHHSKSVN